MVDFIQFWKINRNFLLEMYVLQKQGYFEWKDLESATTHLTRCFTIQNLWKLSKQYLPCIFHLISCFIKITAKNITSSLFINFRFLNCSMVVPRSLSSTNDGIEIVINRTNWDPTSNRRLSCTTRNWWGACLKEWLG